MPLTEESTSQLRDWWYRAMTDPSPASRAEALEHLSVCTGAEASVAHSEAERLELRITEGILAFIEENLNPIQEENSGAQDPAPPVLHW